MNDKRYEQIKRLVKNLQAGAMNEIEFKRGVLDRLGIIEPMQGLAPIDLFIVLEKVVE